MKKNQTVRVSILTGSRSDFPIMEKAQALLKTFRIPSELNAISAHRAPDRLLEFLGSVEQRGVEVIIAGAGGAAHLPGVVAAKILLPVIGVPIPSSVLLGMDALLSIVQMPRGVPVATVGIGAAENAALLAAAILALKDPKIRQALLDFRAEQTRLATQ